MQCETHLSCLDTLLHSIYCFSLPTTPSTYLLVPQRGLLPQVLPAGRARRRGGGGGRGQWLVCSCCMANAIGSSCA